MYVHNECTSLWLTLAEDGFVKTETCSQETNVLNMTFRGPCTVIYFYNESQQDAQFLRLI